MTDSAAALPYRLLPPLSSSIEKDTSNEDNISLRSLVAPSEPKAEDSTARRNSRRASVARSILANAATAAAAAAATAATASDPQDRSSRLIEYVVVLSSVPRKKTKSTTNNDADQQTQTDLPIQTDDDDVESNAGSSTQQHDATTSIVSSLPTTKGIRRMRQSCPEAMLLTDFDSFRRPKDSPSLLSEFSKTDLFKSSIEANCNTDERNERSEGTRNTGTECSNNRRRSTKQMKRIESRRVHLISAVGTADGPHLPKAQSCQGRFLTMRSSGVGNNSKKYFTNDITSTGMPETSLAATATSSTSKHCPQPHQPKWLREGGAVSNIRLPGESDGRSAHNGIQFESRVSARFPPEDNPDSPLNLLGVIQFCNPTGEGPQLTPSPRKPHVHYFVLTGEDGRKVYGTCLTTYEEYQEHGIEGSSVGFSPEDMEDVIWQRKYAGERMTCDLDNSCPHFEVEVQAERYAKLYLPRKLCILSSRPYLPEFCTCLTALNELITTSTSIELPILLRRHLSNIFQEVSAPSPGSFDVCVHLNQTAVHFRAPPFHQPLSLVSLPFEILFKCLDIDNLIFVWYSLVLERKVLLVSSCGSILTVCAEILCALLSPLRWSHIYVPMLPRFLTPMLDAPMPYLCGITRENFEYAVGDVSDETVVVDLDQNVITTGCNTPILPPIPSTRLGKLEATIKMPSGQWFWGARGLEKAQIVEMLSSGSSLLCTLSPKECEDMHETASKHWVGWLRSIDDASSAKARQLNTSGNADENKRAEVQRAFLEFFVALLQDYKDFLTMPGETNDGLDTPPTTMNVDGPPPFDEDAFIVSQRQDYQPFLRELCITQQFDDFCTRCMYSPEEPDLIYFNNSIKEKKGRSTLSFIASFLEPLS